MSKNNRKWNFLRIYPILQYRIFRFCLLVRDRFPVIELFSDTLDFSAFSRNQFLIDQIKHVTFGKVDINMCRFY